MLDPQVVRFIEERIDTVPHLEALLLVWESRPQRWTPAQVAARLYIAPEAAASILTDLVRRRLARACADEDDSFEYDGAWDESGERMARVAACYRQQLLQVATLIHSKASTAVRDFARAFRIKKE